ncbi:alpha-1,3-mannosyl-glycoprotein 4-beta-N-acetylglucosaminyltransferase C [Magallana gigas]|uniref:MGAT4 conserved region domain-containing protein n=1 Tax=Magallana gigas TaxID=29159 RepID=A0A8W8ME91_MAGGI|nr:alpha-1,3-mannosyl-glycoprotein 4-beta-N-acetylglucosaminyltransferase C [Crassostrea gigas]XP_034309572.1 alpha-1,3-mannosyl-glycoprotein 4-beta-N-acetylglucosaminyltransferase C [Crassostrea gigas]
MVTMRCSRQQFVVCLISASAITVFSLVTQFLVLFQSNSYTIKKRCSGYESSEFSNKIQHRTFNKVTYKDYLDRPSSDLTRLQNEWRIDATLFHNFPKEKRYLTIGIPTIKRVGDEYIMDTINSLVNNTRPEQLKDIYIVIFLADFNETWREDISGRLNESYPQLISSETLVVISSWKSFYPSLENLNHTYNDNYNKRKWRSKQNVDYAFIFLYCQHLSTYYMQMEDDIYTVPNYLKVVKDYISTMNFPWTCLEFSELGFIGKLYHSYDLEKLAKIVLLFYEEQPCDFTYLYFNTLMLQFQRIIHRPTIFQHVGLKSSLPGKVQPLKDRFFDNMEKTYKGDNPPAKLYTNLVVQSSFTPESAYFLEPGYFWSKGNGKRGDWFTVVFDDPQKVKKIVIVTGSREHQTDKIEHGKLQASLSLLSIDQSQPKCTNDIDLGYLTGGVLKVDNLTSILGPFRIHCLSIILTANQDWWIIIKEIAVFVAD